MTISPKLIDRLNKLASHLTELGEYDDVDLIGFATLVSLPLEYKTAAGFS